MQIVPEDVPKTLFALQLGTYVSNVLQAGDANGPLSFQRLIMYSFCEEVG